MSLNTQKYQRKTFFIDAVQVDLDNMEEVAEWCGGEIILDNNGGRLVQHIRIDVEHAINERQKKAFVNDWVLKMGAGFKCYSKRAFPNNFEPVKNGVTAEELAQSYEKNFESYGLGPSQEPLFGAPLRELTEEDHLALEGKD